MSADSVQALSFDDFEDDADVSPKQLSKYDDQENAPPRTFSKPIFASPNGAHLSRPVTANSTFSELEEMDLDTSFAPPASGKGGGKSISSPSRASLLGRAKWARAKLRGCGAAVVARLQRRDTDAGPVPGVASHARGGRQEGAGCQSREGTRGCGHRRGR